MSAAEPKIIYTSGLPIASENEWSALTAIYRRAIERYEEKCRGGPATAPEDAMKGLKHDRASDNYTGT